jgi:hypothetical protein
MVEKTPRMFYEVTRLFIVCASIEVGHSLLFLGNGCYRHINGLFHSRKGVISFFSLSLGFSDFQGNSLLESEIYQNALVSAVVAFLCERQGIVRQPPVSMVTLLGKSTT